MKTVTLNTYNIYADSLDEVSVNTDYKIVINTINAHSYIVAKNDYEFERALVNSDILLPDGEGIVFMIKKVIGPKIKKIAGADIHSHLLKVSNKRKLKCFYLGASQNTLDIIKNRLSKEYPNIPFGFYSPPFKDKFTLEDNKEMIVKVNQFSPDVLFVGMTAPKQEKWVNQNKELINASVICSIGAVFDFVAETKKRAPLWVIRLKMEWLHRALSSWRLTKRYLYSNPLFIWEIIKLKTTRKPL